MQKEREERQRQAKTRPVTLSKIINGQIHWLAGDLSRWTTHELDSYWFRDYTCADVFRTNREMEGAAIRRAVVPGDREEKEM